MSTKFHIGNNGPAKCTAKPGNCPLGGEHFDSEKDAEKAFAKTMEDKTFSTFSSEQNLENKFSKSTELDDKIEIQQKTIKDNEHKLENLSKAEESLAKAIDNENRNLSEFQGESNKLGVVNSHARSALTLLDRANRVYGNMNPSFPTAEYKDLNSISRKLSRERKLAQSEIETSKASLAKAESDKEKLNKYLKDKTGYSENPKYGTPTGKTTLEEYKGKQAGNYSSNPTKDVPVLSNAERFCTKCGDTVEYDPKAYRPFHTSNNEYKCNPEKLPAGSSESYLSSNSICRFCGTGDPSRTEFKQMAYSDETHCKRCGGVDGYGIGD